MRNDEKFIYSKQIYIYIYIQWILLYPIFWTNPRDDTDHRAHRHFKRPGLLLQIDIGGIHQGTLHSNLVVARCLQEGFGPCMERRIGDRALRFLFFTSKWGPLCFSLGIPSETSLGRPNRPKHELVKRVQKPQRISQTGSNPWIQPMPMLDQSLRQSPFMPSDSTGRVVVCQLLLLGFTKKGAIPQKALSMVTLTYKPWDLPWDLPGLPWDLPWDLGVTSCPIKSGCKSPLPIPIDVQIAPAAFGASDLRQKNLAIQVADKNQRPLTEPRIWGQDTRKYDHRPQSCTKHHNFVRSFSIVRNI